MTALVDMYMCTKWWSCAIQKFRTSAQRPSNSSYKYVGLMRADEHIEFALLCLAAAW